MWVQEVKLLQGEILVTNLLGPPMTRREYEPVAKYARKLIEAYEQHRVPKRPMSIDDFLLQEAYYLYHGVKWVRLGFPTREVTRCSGRLSDAVHQDGIGARAAVFRLDRHQVQVGAVVLPQSVQQVEEAKWEKLPVRPLQCA